MQILHSVIDPRPIQSEATPLKDTFVSCGLPATFVEDLQQAIAVFEQEIAGRNAGKTGAAVSQQAIRAALKKGLDTVLSLDVQSPTDHKSLHVRVATS